MVKYDFSGWATRANLKCSDGRVIMPDAFAHNDGATVPLVWNHQHNDPESVLGHALLENRGNEGVYAYCTFNDTEVGKHAKLMVQHGDVKSLSIYANNLRQNMSNVVHGNIRELSLVLAGANPGAYIDSIIKHGESSDDEAIIYNGEELSLYHSEEGATVKDILGTLTEEQMNAVYYVIGELVGDDEDMAHSDESEEAYVKEVLDTLNDDQREAVEELIEDILEDIDDSEDEEYEESQGGQVSMKHNVFDGQETMTGAELSHSQMQSIISDAKRYGSLKESFLAHADDYGIDQIEWLFPEARTLTNQPTFIQRDMGWVTKVMGAVSKNPFSRIKSMFADITEDEARAKGYMKGNYKKKKCLACLNVLQHLQLSTKSKN